VACSGRLERGTPRGTVWSGGCLCFFFQAEDGIRDFHVTGVQTCALPIFLHRAAAIRRRLVPTPRLAAATAPVAEAATVDTVAVMVEGEAAMVAEAATMAVMAVGAVIAVVEVITAGAVGAVTTVAEGVAAHTV